MIVRFWLLNKFVAVFDNTSVIHCYSFAGSTADSILFPFRFPHFSFCLLNYCTLIRLQAPCKQREMFAVIAQGDRGSLRKYRFPETAQKGKPYFYLCVQWAGEAAN